ncbi:beta-ketoacyl-ACP synthase III [Cellulomonas sp. NPDC055163]
MTAALLAGLGGALGARLVTNDMLAATLDTSDAWISQRTGIRQRYVASAAESTGDLAVTAGRRALESAGGGAVDLVVVATTTPDHPCPATAPTVASRLGLGTVPAYDVAAVCSGFLYALAAGTAAVESGRHQRVLVVGAETYSRIVDPTDRGTAILFGDGAGAVVLESGEPGDPGAVGSISLHSDGGHRELITVEEGGSRHPADPTGARTARGWFTMQGRQVFALATRAMTAASRSALDAAGWATGDVDWLVAHQANRRILDAVAGELGVDPERAVVHVDRVGNTSAASIPLALCHASPGMTRGDRVLLTAFGGGATWGAVTLTWPGLVARDITPEREWELS